MTAEERRLFHVREVFSLHPEESLLHRALARLGIWGVRLPHVSSTKEQAMTDDTILEVLTESEYHQLNNDMGGICYACGEVDDCAYCEPDARNYRCGACGERRLHGIEQALLEGRIDIVEAS